MKPLARLIGSVLALPTLLRYLLLRCAVERDRAFAYAAEGIAKRPGLLGVYARQAFFGWTLASVGRDVHFGFMSLLSKTDAEVADGVYIGRFCTIGRARIGRDALLADGVQILSGARQHGSASEAGEALKDNAPDYRTVTIGEGAWLGAHCVVMADVGERAVVAAGAVVTRPVEPDTRVAGVPAKPMHKAGDDVPRAYT